MAETGAIFYLAFPVFLFFAAYVRPIVSIPACAFMAVLAAGMLRRTDRMRLRVPSNSFWAIAAICIAWLWLSGGFGDIRQNGDWVKHYAIINYLASQPHMSLVDASSPGHEFLRYSIAWYVVPAFAVRLSSGHFQAIFSSAWTLVGLLLFFINLRSLTRGGAASVVAACAFIFFSGADIVGYAITHLQPGPRFHLEWWSGWAEYGSNTTSLFWVPQHALAAWLGIAVLMLQMERPTLLPFMALLFSASLLWSPFVVIGLAPFAIAVAIRHSVKEVALSWQALLTLTLVALPIVVYLRSDASGVPHSFIWNDGCFGRALCFTWWGYARFMMIEIGLPSIILLSVKSERRAFLWVALGSLLVFPLIHIGAFNDFTMRASIPALAVLAVGIARLIATDRRTAVIVAVSACIALGAATPLGEMARPFVAEKTEPGPKIRVAQSNTFDDLSTVWSSLRYQYFAQHPIWILR